MIGEALKSNNTLTTLNLSGMMNSLSCVVYGIALMSD